MKGLGLFFLALSLVLVQFLVGGIVWQTLPFIAVIVFFTDYLLTLPKTKRLRFGQPLWKARDFGTGISLNPESKTGYYSLVIISLTVVIVAFAIYLILIFHDVENVLHRISGWH